MQTPKDKMSVWIGSIGLLLLNSASLITDKAALGGPRHNLMSHCSPVGCVIASLGGDTALHSNSETEQCAKMMMLD